MTTVENGNTAREIHKLLAAAKPHQDDPNLARAAELASRMSSDDEAQRSCACSESMEPHDRCLFRVLELAQYGKRQFPGLNVVMVSGHGAPYIPHDTHFLMKPYQPQQLLDAVLR